MRGFLKAGLVWLVLVGAFGLASGEDIEARIIGGAPANLLEGESFAILMAKFTWGSGDDFLWQPACGASYIGDGLVMTAAHCIRDREYKIWLGDPGNKMGYESLSCGPSACTVVPTAPIADEVYTALKPAFNSELYDINVSGQVRDILVHKNYKVTTLANDIALIRLAAAPASIFVDPIGLPTSNDFPSLAFSNRNVTVIGLGDTTYSTDTFKASSDLLKLDLPAVTAAACSSRYSSYNDDIMVCAGFANGFDGSDRKDSCQGDSGGPLMHNPGGGYIQYGIVSFGLNCADTYGVYADVYGLSYWIDNVKAFWLESIDFDWSVDFGTTEESMSRSVNWEITNDSGRQISLGSWDYNDLSTGFSVGSNQCGSTLSRDQTCSIRFDANFNSVGSYDGEVFFNADGKIYELKFIAAVTDPSTTTNRFSGSGGAFSPFWLLFMVPLALFRRTRKGPLLLVLLTTLGITACSSNPFQSDPPEVVFNPAITQQGLEFSVMSNGCTVENHLLLRVKGDEVEVVRTQPDMCRAMPQLKRFVMPLPEQETVWQLVNPVRYSNRVSRGG